MTEHTLTAELDVQFHVAGMPDDEREAVRLSVLITYLFTQGAPEVRYQRNGDPGWPADPDEVEFVSAKLINGDGIAATQTQIDAWAESWLYDGGYGDAVDNARRANEPDPDYMRDIAEEDRDLGFDDGDELS